MSCNELLCHTNTKVNRLFFEYYVYCYSGVLEIFKMATFPLSYILDIQMVSH